MGPCPTGGGGKPRRETYRDSFGNERPNRHQDALSESASQALKSMPYGSKTVGNKTSYSHNGPDAPSIMDKTIGRLIDRGWVPGKADIVLGKDGGTSLLTRPLSHPDGHKFTSVMTTMHGRSTGPETGIFMELTLKK